MVDKRGIRDKFTGGLLGAALGDAIGESIGCTLYDFEGFSGSRVPVKEVNLLVQALPALRYTDDTHMTIGVAESLVACRGFDGAHMAGRFIYNYNSEPWRGYGPGPPRVFRRIEDGQAWNRAAADVYPDGSYGNGAAMRASPLGLFYYERHAQLVEAAYHASRITHYHPLGIEGGILQALAVALAADADPSGPLDVPAFIDTLAGYTTEEVYLAKLADFPSLLADPADKERVIERLGHGVEAFNSAPTALFAFLANPADFPAAVSYAVSLGGDTDTIASMTGALAGAYLGAAAIPGAWKDKLENRDYLSSLARKLYGAETA